jgi:hypothetical protein
MLSDIVRYAEDTDVVKIIDTDSLFIRLPGNDTGLIKEIEDDLNKEMLNFMDRHNMNRTDFVRMRLKNEFVVSRMVAYKIKRYIACTVDPVTGKKDVEVRGVEGRRAAQQYVVDLVDEITRYIQGDAENFNLRDVLWDIINKIESAVKEYDFSYLGNPINPPKNFAELKSIGAHTRGMLIYNTLFGDFFGQTFSKGLHVPITLSPIDIENNDELRKVCEQVINKFGSFPSIKLRRAKRDSDAEFYAKLIRDITVPEIVSPTLYLGKLRKIGIRIDVEEIVNKFAKKFNVLCFPFYEHFNFNFIDEFSKVFEYISKKYTHK